MDEMQKGLQDHIGMVLRRKWLILLPFLALFTVSVGLALLLPPVYRSSATILIEEPDVPRELVSSTITGFADQRLQVINQRVMATKNLLEIVRKYDLYADARQRQPVNEVIEGMRKAIGMELISASVRDPRGGSAGEATIAFKLWFEDESPASAQRVANELAALYISENARERQEKVSETSDFLSNEVRRLEANIAELEKQLTELKVSHAGSLPEQRDYNLKSIDRSDQELRDLELRSQTLKERMIFLRSTLAQIAQSTVVTPGNERVLSPAEQLRLLRYQLSTVSQRYTAEHPDVVQLQREIEALEKEVKNAPTAAGTQQKPQEQPDGIAQSNPAYFQLQSELQAAQSELLAIEVQKDAVRARIKNFAERIEQTPLVERKYQELTRALDAASGEYRQVRAKLTMADLGRSLETEHKGERFSIIEPPFVPTEPIRPNRKAILLIGFVLSAAAGVGLGFLREMADTAVYSLNQAVAITGSAPLAIVPYIRTRGERLRAWRWRAAVGVGTFALVAGAVIVVHIYVRPLDLVWASVERRIEAAGFPLGS